MTELTEQVRAYVEVAFDAVTPVDLRAVTGRLGLPSRRRPRWRVVVALATVTAVVVLLVGWLGSRDDSHTFPSVLMGGSDRRGFELADDWSRAFGEPPLAPPVVAGTSVIVATAVDIATVSTVHALDAASGKVRWIRRLDQRVDAVPVAAPGTVLVLLTDGQLLALDAGDGTTRWAVRTGTNVKGPAPPVVHGGRVYIGSQHGDLRSIDLATGRVRWRRTLDFGVQVTPVLQDGVLYVATGELPFGSHSRGSVYALDAATGKQRWHVRVDGPIVSAFTVDPLVVAVTATQFEGSQNDALWVIDRRAGTVNWHATPGGHLSAPATTRGRVVVATAAGTLEARAEWLTGTGAGQVSAHTPIGPTQSPELVARGYVIATGATGVVAVEADTGGPVWRASVRAAHLTVSPGSRYIVAQGQPTGDLAYIDSGDGRILARRVLHDTPLVALAGHRIYRLDYRGTITASSLRFRDDLPASLHECKGANESPLASPDGLPAKGSTANEAQARAVLATNADQIRARYPGVRDLRVTPRNGAVWDRQLDGAITTEIVHDYWIVVELKSSRDCPSNPAGFNGVPLRFVAPAK